jgi:uncharacterized protein YabE (DUF348 family)
VILAFLISLTACTPPQVTPDTFTVTISVDGTRKDVEVTSGSTVEAAIEKAGIQLGNLDRVEPPAITILTVATEISITRVEETFEVEESVVPF